MATRNPVFAVIGLGPVGSILAGHLAASKADVVVQDAMPSILEKVRQDGIMISGMTKIMTKIDKIANSISQIAEFDPKIVFIVTKACYLKDILPEIERIYTPRMKIVSFQNGLDNEQVIARELGIAVAYRVVINYAGNLVHPGHAMMNWFQPPNYVGALRNGKYVTDETTKEIASALTTAGLKTEESANIKMHIWEKTILNSALCSICGVTGQTMKEAMEYEPSRNLAIRILEEGLRVAKADGYDFGSEALTKFATYLDNGGAHKPSMLIDVENKRPTEIDFMSGSIAHYGEKYKIPTPVNSTFTDLIRTIEHHYHKQ
jgi:2-dehydropantoate 2-reductase